MVVDTTQDRGGSHLFGRDAALARLASHARAAAAGSGRLVWIAGEAGIGKTRLLAALDEMVTGAGGLVLHGSAWEAAGTPPFWVWTQVLREAASRLGEDELVRRSGARGQEALALLATSGTPPPRPDDDGASRFPLFDGFEALLEGLSGEAAVAVLLDDVHWTDVGSLRLLQFLERGLARRRVLLAVTWRDHEVGSETPLGALAQEISTRAERMLLTGLEPGDVARLVALTGGGQVTTEQAAELYRRTLGNPLYVAEFGRLLHARGWSEVVREIPASARGIIRRRVVRLSQRCHELLAMAAVVGPVAPTELLGHLTGESPLVLLEILDEAVAADLARIRLGAVEFSHPLVRETLARDVSAARAREIHLAVGAALLPTLAAEPSLAAQVGHHLIEALPLGDVVTAVDVGEQAARLAFRAQAYEEAARHYETLLAVVDPAAPRRFELALGHADALLAAGDHAAGRTAYLNAADLARAAGDPARLARAALGFSAGLSGFEVRLWDQAQLDLLDEALAALPVADTDLRADLLARLSVAVSFTDRAADSRALAETALDMARRACSDLTIARALAAHCDAIAGPGHAERREEASGEVIRLARGVGDRGIELLGLRLRVVALLEQGKLTAAQADMATFGRIAERVRQPGYSWYVPLWKGFLAHIAGDLDEMGRCSAEAARIGALAESRNAATLSFVQQLWLAFERMQAAGIRDQFAEVLADLGELAPDGGGLLDLFPGAPSSTRSAARARIDELVNRLPEDAEYVANLCHIARGMWEAGEEGPWAEPVYRALLPHAHRFSIDGIAAGSHGSVVGLLGALAALMGESDLAARHFDEARSANAAAGFALPLAHTCRMYAELLARGNRPEDRERAERLMDEARADYERMGLPELVALASFDRAGRRREDGPASTIVPGRFVRTGDVWEVSYHGVSVSLPHVKGMGDLALLLARPAREVHVLDLVAAGAGVTQPGHGHVEAVRLPGDLGGVIDHKAREAYRRRLVELDEALREADELGHADAAERVQQEKDALVEQLAAAYGIGGRLRRTGDPAERARSTVTARLRDAIRRIARVHPELGRHLAAAVRTGVYCSYLPELDQSWEV